MFGNDCFENWVLNFLLILAFIMFKLKENKMTYYFLGSNPNYNMPLNFNSFVPTFYYPTYENCAVISPMIFN